MPGRRLCHTGPVKLEHHKGAVGRRGDRLTSSDFYLYELSWDDHHYHCRQSLITTNTLIYCTLDLRSYQDVHLTSYRVHCYTQGHWRVAQVTGTIS